MGQNGGRGDQGPIGLKGDRGGTGEKGDSGRNGRAGEKGGMGQNGGAGPKGDRGEKGERGQVGPKGQRGDKGEKGDSGIITTKPGKESGQKGECGLSGHPKNCGEIQRASNVSGFEVRTIYPFGNSSAVKVQCDFETDGGGWTVIQKRKKGPKEEFYRNWADYAGGFYGSESEGARGNYWIGLNILHALTNPSSSLTTQSLRVDLTDWSNRARFAQYSSFSVGDSRANYKLNLGGYLAISSAGDRLQSHKGYMFSTKDRDNDADGSRTCAQTYKGAWWYNDCYTSNLNGLYLNPSADVSDSHSTGIFWSGLQKTTSLKIRDADFTKFISFG